MSSNEKLAALAKSGNKQAIYTLWTQVEKLCSSFSARFIAKFQKRCNACAITNDDLMQECFLALLEAVQAYKPESEYKFTTYLYRCVLNRFNVLSGYRTKRAMNDPINNSKSLHEAISEIEDITIMETLPDDTATEEFENIIEREYIRQLHYSLEQCMNTLTDNQRAVIKAYYYHNRNYNEICKSSEITYYEVRKLHQTGLNKLRTNSVCRKILKEYRKEIFSYSIYRSGLSAFKYRQASIAEIYAERYSRN